jgi:hypothetical protein
LDGGGGVECLGVTGEQPAPCFRFVNRPESLGFFWNQVDNAGNRQLLVHAKKIPRGEDACYHAGTVDDCARHRVDGAMPREVLSVLPNQPGRNSSSEEAGARQFFTLINEVCARHSDRAGGNTGFCDTVGPFYGTLVG